MKRYRIFQTDMIDGKPTPGWHVESIEPGIIAMIASIAATGEGEAALRAAYDTAVQVIAAELSALAAAAAPEAPGLLPEGWSSPEGMGIVYATATGDGRDFTGCKFSWRDPKVSVVPLMLQTETDMGHFGAELAGFVEKFTKTAGGVSASGRFYDSDVGVTFRDMLLGDRSFGVSVDGGSVDYVYECLEEDADGWCIDDKLTFLAYQIIGLTGTPFPAFAEAKIGLASVAVAAGAFNPVQVSMTTMATWNNNSINGKLIVPVTAAAIEAPDYAPRAWFEMPEPDDSDIRYVEQPNGHLAIPLTVTDEGQVFGHIAVQGTCHTGITDRCQDVPTSSSGYAHFNLAPTRCEDGTRIGTGPLTVGCDHAPLSYTAQEARDFYAHSGLGWADVRASQGYHGPWIAGALRPGLSDPQLRMILGSVPSGDWRPIGGSLELVGAHQVNQPGFPVLRERALAAAGGAEFLPVNASGAKALIRDGEVLALVAAGVVRSCPDCERRRLEAVRASGAELDLGDVRVALGQLQAVLAVVERRTRHLIPVERDDFARRLSLVPDGVRVIDPNAVAK